VILKMDIVTGEQTILNAKTNLSIAAGVGDFSKNVLYALVKNTYQLYKVDVNDVSSVQLVGDGVPSKYQQQSPAITLSMDSAANTIYAALWDGFNSHYALYKIDLNASPIQPVIIAKNWGGGNAFPDNYFVTINGAGTGIMSGGSQVFFFNLQTGNYTSVNFTKLGNNRVALWWWDAPRSRMTAFISTSSGIVYSMVDFNDMSLHLIANLSHLEKVFLKVDNYAYDPVSDLLWIKGEGVWHARHRNMTYVAIDPATGNIQAEIPVWKDKGGGDAWDYTGPRITNELVAFLAVSNGKKERTAK